MFGVALVCLLGVSVPILMAPGPAGAVVSATYQWMARELGLIYQWTTLFTLAFLAWLALGRYGTRVLGRTPGGGGGEPEYGNASWMAMLFCAGIGGGLMYWSTIEWAFYVDQPPFGVAPASVAAREWAATYGIFHWGPLPRGASTRCRPSPSPIPTTATTCRACACPAPSWACSATAFPTGRSGAPSTSSSSSP